MKTRSIISIILVITTGMFVPIPSFSQLPDSIAEYYPLQIGNRWNYVSWDWFHSIPDTTYRWSDEIINTINLGGQQYYNLARNINLTSPQYDTLRTDSLGKVWEYYPEGDVLLYDFTLLDSSTYTYQSEYVVTVEHHSYVAGMIGVDSSINFAFDIPHATDSYHEHLFIPHLGPVWEYWAWRGTKILESAILNGELITSSPDIDLPPSEYILSQNYPNPFNPSTLITFSLAKTSDVALRIFNVLGEEVGVLVNERMSGGIHTIPWNAEGLPGGVYLCRIETGKIIETKKMVLVK
jgi:hypothetical protein